MPTVVGDHVTSLLCTAVIPRMFEFLHVKLDVFTIHMVTGRVKEDQ